jgi:hypothetical protein
MDFLRQYLSQAGEKKARIICFSGRGGERLSGNSMRWETISREEIKRIFRDSQADILLCTDAAAEGLNFQFCGALINYDMPWNPMRVEQRIGRIDRLGQVFADKGISILNLHYEATVETDVYLALKARIDLFKKYVGGLQPILATLSQKITTVVLSSPQQKEANTNNLIQELDRETARKDIFDIDKVTRADLEEIPISPTLYDLHSLDRLLQRPDLLPPEIEVTRLQPREYRLAMVGMNQSLRITTDPQYYDQHSSSTELWSPGNPLFPIVAEVDTNLIPTNLDDLY